MQYRITLIPGDGIGPEITAATQDVLTACDLKIDWEVHNAGASVVETFGHVLPDSVLDSIRKNRIALKGPVTTPVGKGFRSVNVTLRKALDLYACMRPVRSFPGVASPWSNVNLTVVRENTEGLYSGMEHEVSPGIAVAFKVTTRQASEKIARFACEYAKKEGRRKITVAHKASVVRLSESLFRETVVKVAADYPFIEIGFLPIDNLAMALALDPTDFEVLLMENLFGDIVSDMASGLVGGLGLVPGANIGDRCAVFEAVHGSAPDIAGRGKANPTALILSAALMLHHIGERSHGERINEAVDRVLESGKVRTVDLGGTAGTKEMTQAIIEALPSA